MPIQVINSSFLINGSVFQPRAAAHQQRQADEEYRPEVRRVVLAASLTFVIIVFHLTLNELVEVDKIGPVFFVCLALLIRCGTWLKEESRVEDGTAMS